MASVMWVGVDLGTTNSASAVLGAGGQPEALDNSEGAKTTPSVVQVAVDGTFLVGAQARQLIVLEKENTGQFFKRDMGTTATYTIRGRDYTPVDFSAAVLAKMKRDAEARLGHPVTKVVVTVPAYFQDAPRNATRDAASRAGLEVRQLLNEPTAAALAYGFRPGGRPERIAVLDLGGGTFDVSVVNVTPTGIEVVGTGGHRELGGKDWDDRLVTQVSAIFEQRHGRNPLADAFDFQEILVRVEGAKRALSDLDRTAIQIASGGIIDRVEIARTEFEAMTGDLKAQVEQVFRGVLSDAGVRLGELDAVVLAGGSTRMPMVREVARDLTGKAPCTAVDPDLCVAYGAAIQSAILAEETSGPRFFPCGDAQRVALPAVRDVSAHSMGMIAVNDAGDRYVNCVLIPRNLPIPALQVQPFRAAARAGSDNTVSVYVTQGEGGDPAHCTFVGKYVVSGFCGPIGPKDIVDISYSYDGSSLVGVSAKVQGTGQELAVQREPLPEDMSWVFDPPRAPVKHMPKKIFVTIDLSGSMTGGPLAEAKIAFKRMVAKLDPKAASVGLISFADSVEVDLAPSHDAAAIDRAVDHWRIGPRGIGNSRHPFDQVMRDLGDDPGCQRFCVVLTDGVWSCQDAAIAAAKKCHRAQIGVIALGFGHADHAFLKKIASSDDAALFVEGDLGGAFENVAQVILESKDHNLDAARLLGRRGR